MRVLIAGCGDVGIGLGLLLARAGHEVRGVRRSAARIPAPIQALPADLTDAASLPRWPIDIDTVFYTAAADRSDEPAYRAAYLVGLANLLAWARAGGGSVRRLCFTSSTAVYGQANGEWVDETSATEPGHFSGRILLEAERMALESGIPTTVVRFAGIYGPGRMRLLTGIRDGTASCGAGPPAWSNRIHRDDCAGFLAHLAAGVTTPAPVYVGVDDEPTERCTLYHWLAQRLGSPSPHRPEQASAEPAGRGGSKRCRNALLRGTGYRLRFPTFREGYAPLIDGLAAPTPP